MDKIYLIILLINQSVIEAAAVLCAIIFFAMSIFQFLLVFGAPFGKLAWGGKYKILPLSLRIGSFFSAIIFIISAIVMLDKIKFINVFSLSSFFSVLIWFMVVIFGLSILGNILSKSEREKRIMTPIAMVLFLLCLIIAIGG